MGTHFQIEPISAEQTYDLRRDILRAGRADANVTYEHDLLADTLHLGAIAGDEVVSIASVHAEPPPFATEHEVAWRLRGMATVEHYRGRGVGKFVLATAMQHIFEQGGTLLWCNARLTACRFYERLGFAEWGEQFDDGNAMHVVMWRELSAD